jgi:hypothetical protein
MPTSLASTSRSAFDDLLHGLEIATAEGVDRRLQLTFDQAPHLQDAGANVFQFKIELFAEMIIHWLALFVYGKESGSLRRPMFRRDDAAPPTQALTGFLPSWLPVGRQLRGRL